MRFSAPRVICTFGRVGGASWAGIRHKSNRNSGRVGRINTMALPPLIRPAASRERCVRWPAPSMRSGFDKSRQIAHRLPSKAIKAIAVGNGSSVIVSTGRKRPSASANPRLWLSCPALPSLKRQTTSGYAWDFTGRRGRVQSASTKSAPQYGHLALPVASMGR